MEIKKENNKVKVLHFVHWSRSGVTTLVKHINDYSSNIENGFILLNDDVDFKNFYKAINNKKQLKFNKNKLKSIFNFTRYLDNFKPDIVHTHSLTPLLISFIFCKNIILVHHVHSYYSFFYKNDIKSYLKKIFLRFGLRRAQLVLTVSSQSAEFLLSELNVRAVCLINGVPDVGTVRSDFSEIPHAGRFYNVSRIHKDKNLEYAIDITRELRLQGHQASLDIFGQGDYMQTLENYIEFNGLSEYVRLMGYSEHPETLPANYDFYLSTSLIEGIGLSMIDALRGGIPVIMTKTGELVNILQDGKSGVFIDFDVKSSADKIQTCLLGNDKKALQYQSEGRNVYQKHFSIDTFIENLENEYRNILSFSIKDLNHAD